MDKLLDSFVNETNNLFSEILENHIGKKLENREDYIELRKQINAIYEELPKIRDFIEDVEPINFGKNETKEFYKLVKIFNKIKMLELKEAFKLGAKEVLIFLKEQDML